MNSKNTNIDVFNHSGALDKRSESSRALGPRRYDTKTYQEDSSPDENKAGRELQALVADLVQNLEVRVTAPFYGDRERRFDVLDSLYNFPGRQPEYRPYFSAGLEEGLNDKKGLYSSLRSGDDVQRFHMSSEDAFLVRLFNMIKDEKVYKELILRFVEETFAVWVCDAGLEPDTCYESLRASPELQQAALRSLEKGGNDLEKWKVYFVNKADCLESNPAYSSSQDRSALYAPSRLRADGKPSVPKVIKPADPRFSNLKAGPEGGHIRRLFGLEDAPEPVRDFKNTDSPGTSSSTYYESSVVETGRQRQINDPFLADALIKGFCVMLQRNGEPIPDWVEKMAGGNEGANPQDLRTSSPKGLDYNRS
jgi:hypothetical protein